MADLVFHNNDPLLSKGDKVGEDLRGQVRQAIETLGNGFLDGDLIRRLQQNKALCRRYYGEILQIIYRILFLLFAEQRGMMPGRDSLYAEAYSIARLRARAEGDIHCEDDSTGLWEGLKVTFRMVREGVPELDVFGYDGMLFDDDQIPLLNGLPSPEVGRGDGGEGHPRACRNSDLLRAIRALTLIEREGVLQRISYADLEVEELGSIYESLLDYTPRVTTGPEDAGGREIPANTLSTGPSTSPGQGLGRSSGRRFFLDPRGLERKTTGSYYTHPSLVNELIKSALLPVVRDRLAAAGLPVIEEEAIGEATAGLLTDYAGLTDAQRAAGEAALLAIKVCDPAAGSGHFLVKADNALGAELARIRTGDEYPTEAQVQAAKRDVLAHCIYAVDVNPMAVELCKVSLWINASVADRPLSFLDHHIKCGNSLIGATPELMEEGIPYEAFDPKIVGNDRATANAIRKRNREEQAGQLPLGWRVTVIEMPEDLERWRRLSRLAEEQPCMAREQYAEYITATEHQHRKLEADFWTAAFFWPLPKGVKWVPTHGEFMRLRAEGPEALPPKALAQIEALVEHYRFFHWHLEFPGVFQTSEVSETSEVSGGFDVVLGNPPWERIKLQEKEFFADRDPEIANARPAAERRRLIQKLAQTNPVLATEYAAALRRSEGESKFVCNSNHYPLTGVGDVNTYAVFVELILSILNSQGRAGLVVPSGIATDYTYRKFFAEIMNRGSLVSLWDFENREGLFPETHRSYKFSLLILTGDTVPAADFAFFLRNVDDLANEERHFALTREDLALFNPNTRTCSVFRTRRDVELTHKIYSSCPVLVHKVRERNPWGISFLRMLDMTNDSDLFHTQQELETQGLQLSTDLLFRGNGQEFWPLYEGRMIHHFDHRVASVGVNSGTTFRSGVTLETTLAQHKNSNFRSRPRYWVERTHVLSAIPATYDRDWFVGFKDVTSSTNERTMICTVIPRTAVGNKIPLILTNETARRVCGLVANLSSFVLDYVTRQKIGGITLNFYIVEQLPIIPPERYTSELLDLIVPRVLELTYTAWTLQSFALDLEYEGPPFSWDEKRRAHLRAELDAIYAHLYGLSRDEMAYILETFSIVRRRDTSCYGRYRTKQIILHYYDEFSGSIDRGMRLDLENASIRLV